jgi:hypothetical protein
MTTRLLPSEDFVSEVEQGPRSAQHRGQLPSGDRDQAVLRGVLQIEQVEQRLGGSITVGYLAE